MIMAYMGLEKKVTLKKNMLEFNVDLSAGSFLAKAVDGQKGQGWSDCANTDKVDSRLMWLTIDLGRLYSVSNVKMLSRAGFGTGSEIYVGKSAIQADGSIDPAKDHKCGDKYSTSSTLQDFLCSSIHWVQYVTIRRKVSGTTKSSYYFQVCEVEVYFSENEGTASF